MFAAPQHHSRQLTRTVDKRGKGPCTLTPTEEHKNENAMNTKWHTELKAMKTMVAGAVGADCGEAKPTHCGPLLEGVLHAEAEVRLLIEQHRLA